MSESWRRWEGQVVNGKFRLQTYLGGSEHSGVFLTQRGADESQKAAIKFIPAGAEIAAARFSRWERAAKLTHPALLRIFETGRCELGEAKLLYVVSEYADEDLSQILPERALTPDETWAMLLPVLKALSYLHGRGLVHGQLKPSNVFAVGDQVKVSSDTIRAAGEMRAEGRARDAHDPPEAAQGLQTCGDVWSLGVALVEVLTQRPPAWDRSQGKSPAIPTGIPEPFREIAGHCLEVDPRRRWTVAEVLARLDSAKVQAARSQGPRPEPARPAMQKPAAGVAPGPTLAEMVARWWPYALVLVAVVVIGLILTTRSRTPSPSSQAQPAQAQATQSRQAGATASDKSRAEQARKPSPLTPGKTSAARRTSEAPGSTGAVSPSAGESPKAGGTEAPSGAIVKGAVAHQVLPEVSPKARDTIEGKVRVRVRVQVDTLGNVVAASFDSPGPSKYFARLAMEAAQQWKFAPAQVNGKAAASEWTLRFAFGRTETEVYPVETAP